MTHHNHRNDRAARGYGRAHKQLRAAWAPAVARGDVTCVRCGLPIPPDAPWDLGHDDNDRTQYAGPEHRRCNRGAPSRRRRNRPQPHTRRW